MKALRLMTAVLLASLLLAGCGKAADLTGKDTEAQISSVTEGQAQEPALTPEPTAEPTPTPTPEPTPEPMPVFENIYNSPEGHYTFQPHVFGSRYLEQFGEEMRDTFFAYCDALRNGDDTFPCPDQETFGWCVGRLSNFFFPVARGDIEAGVCENGVATLRYTVPKEEFLQKEREFEESVVNILNYCLGDDYSDLEKIIALYEYMTTQYTYDQEMYEQSLELMDQQSPYRCLTEKQGICVEIAGLYNYLLLQVGIDSEEMGGTVHFTEDTAEGHSWVYVTLDGESYHIDPTYGLTYDRPPLCYFMMTDEIRETRDGFPIAEFTLGAKGDESRAFFTYEATDDRYAPLWDGYYIGLDREAKEIVYEDPDGTVKRFSYEG